MPSDGAGNRLRVLVSTGIFPNRSDPTRGVYVFQQVAALARRDHVEVVSPIPWVPRFARSVRYKAFVAVPDSDTLDSVRVRYVRYVVIPKVMRSLHGFFVYLCTLPAHARAVRALHPDVVLSFFAYPYGFAAVLTAATFRRPVVVSCRGSDINHLARTGLRRRLIGWALRRCRSVIAVSHALAAEIERLGVARERIRIVANGIDAVRFRSEDRHDARARLGVSAPGQLVVCVSRLSHEKGIDILLDAVAALDTRDVRVLIVGDGAERAHLLAQRSSLGLDDRVEFAGRRPHEEIGRWMSASDVVVLSSRTEGYPNVLVEALACGRPVVATRVGGVPDIVTDDALGVMVTPEDPAALARGIERALATRWDQARLVAAAQARTWTHVADELHDILLEAAGAATGAPSASRVMAR
jgi:glycosyltransferase involved in cell wall biosynthesis